MAGVTSIVPKNFFFLSFNHFVMTEGKLGGVEGQEGGKGGM